MAPGSQLAQKADRNAVSLHAEGSTTQIHIRTKRASHAERYAYITQATAGGEGNAIAVFADSKNETA